MDIHYSGSLLERQWLASWISRGSVRQWPGSRRPALCGCETLAAARRILGARACFDLIELHPSPLEALHTRVGQTGEVPSQPSASFPASVWTWSPVAEQRECVAGCRSERARRGSRNTSVTSSTPMFANEATQS